MRKIWLLSIALLSLASCNSTKTDVKTSDSTDQYLVFGKYYGHCIDECATLFKLEGTQLFADDLKRFNDWETLKFKTEPLPNARYEAAKALLADFPQELLNAEETIGCPDCADQGGFALEIRKDGKLHHWRIDTNRGDLPAYLQPYVAKIDAIIEQLQ